MYVNCVIHGTTPPHGNQRYKTRVNTQDKILMDSLVGKPKNFYLPYTWGLLWNLHNF